MREFTERVRKKSFIISTLLMPIFMIGLMVAPSLMMLYNTGDQKQIVVIDKSGMVADKLQSSDEVIFISQPDMEKGEACSIYGEESGIFGVLFIPDVNWVFCFFSIFFSLFAFFFVGV